MYDVRIPPIETFHQMRHPSDVFRAFREHPNFFGESVTRTSLSERVECLDTFVVFGCPVSLARGEQLDFPAGIREPFTEVVVVRWCKVRRVDYCNSVSRHRSIALCSMFYRCRQTRTGSLLRCQTRRWVPHRTQSSEIVSRGCNVKYQDSLNDGNYTGMDRLNPRID